MNIKDIAKLAGVSITTVSRVLNNKPGGVSDEKRKYIQEIIKEYEYRPSGLARGLVTKKTSTIGLIISDISNPLYPLMARGIEDYAQKHKYNIILCNTHFNPELEKKYIDILIEKRVDGIIMEVCQGVNEKYVSDILDNYIPIVFIDEPVANKNAYGIFVDNYKGGYIATKHLIELGHEKIACFTGPHCCLSSIERLDGYKQALKKAGLPINESIIMAGPYIQKTGYSLMIEVISLYKDVTAIFAASDNIAMGIYKAAKALGYKIPDDYSVVSFDDVYDMELIEPALTAIVQPTYEMGKRAVDMIIKIIKGSKPRNKKVIFDPELVVRNSTKKYP